MPLCQQLCFLAFRALFENKRAPKRGRNAHFQKSLKILRNGVIKTLCAKDQVCKSIGVTCSTYRRFTKDKEENTRKWPKKGPERAASVFAFLSVCLLPSYRPQFSTQQPNFLKICSLGLWEKRFFSVFRNFDFWPFEGPFSAIFEYFLLYPL